MGTVLVLLALGGFVVWIIMSMVKNKKAGKSLHCGMDCSRCGGHCSQDSITKMK